MSFGKSPGETWDAFAERRIVEAQREGAFDNLPGFGRPIPGIDEPLDDDWWLRAKLRREKISLLPPILEARLQKEKTLAAIRDLTCEREVRSRLESVNAQIDAAHYSPLPGPPILVKLIDVETVVADWKRTRSSN